MKDLKIEVDGAVNLAAAFEDELLPTGLVSRDVKLEAAAAHLRDGGADVLVRLANAKLEAAPGKPSRLLLYVDQWEELYSMGLATVTVGAHVGELARALMSRRTHPETGYRACLGVIRLPVATPAST
ncbi:MAG TPA: hypothetical protein VKU41_10070 [Polyangiaceae bacterium]|nr:hypothetical protein [Polyangiaceae bacterium]